MANPGYAVHQYLQTQSDVTDLVDDRGFANNSPQDLDSVHYVYTTISTGEQQHLGAAVICGFGVSRVQIDVWADDQTDAADAAEAIRLAMLATPPLTMGTLTVDKVLRDSGFNTSEEPVDGSDGWRYRVSQDFVLSHDEATS